MASAFTHSFAALSLGAALAPRKHRKSILLLGTISSILPDADVIGFQFGIEYGDLIGHRGLSHSILFALLWSLLLCLAFFRKSSWRSHRVRIFSYLFLCTLSHSIFDAMTNGGLGIAFLSPFDTTRYFFPFTPVQVSPIGISSFFTSRGWAVIRSEMVWIWLPMATLSLAIHAVIRRRPARKAP